MRKNFFANIGTLIDKITLSCIIFLVGALPSASPGRAGMSCTDKRGARILICERGENVESVATPEIITLIQTVGFPIACCIGLFILLWKMNKTHKEEVSEMKDAFYQQSKETIQAINNNTLAIQKLTDKLDKE